MTKGKLVVLLSMIPLALVSSAAYSYGSSGVRAIKGFAVTYDWYTVINAATSSFDNPDGCGNSGAVMLRKSDAWYKDVFATVMMAQASGQPVVFWVSGCDATPWGYTIPVVQTITVNP